MNKLLIIAVLVTLFSGFVYLLDMPEVWVSHTSGECVKVVPAEAGTCENLPPKYERVIVK